MTLWKLSLLLTVCAAALPNYAHAYIGPGVGAGAIMLTLAVVFGVLLLLFGLIWYPLKRLFARRREKKSQ